MIEPEIIVTEGLDCPNCGAPEVEDESLPVDQWKFNIRAYRVDDWSECRKCGCWFDMEGNIDPKDD